MYMVAERKIIIFSHWCYSLRCSSSQFLFYNFFFIFHLNVHEWWKSSKKKTLYFLLYFIIQTEVTLNYKFQLSILPRTAEWSLSSKYKQEKKSREWKKYMKTGVWQIRSELKEILEFLHHLRTWSFFLKERKLSKSENFHHFIVIDEFSQAHDDEDEKKKKNSFSTQIDDCSAVLLHIIVCMRFLI